MNQQNEAIQKDFNNNPEIPKNFNTASNPKPENQYISSIIAIEKKYEKLQNDLNSINQKNTELEKSKSNFEEQSKKYAMMYKEEFSERKERQGKYVTLQEQHTQKIEEF